MAKEERTVPKFDLGIASGDAFQVEGLPRFSDWYDWSHQPSRIRDFSNADEGTRFWEHFAEDIRLAAELGAKSFKITLSWDRIETTPGHWDEHALAQYQKIIEAIHAAGMEVVLCLQSFVLPRWMAKLGGLCSEDFAFRYAEYCEKVARTLGSVTREGTLWLTFSRPLMWVVKAYAKSSWPPGQKDFSEMLRAAAHLVRAHYLAVNKIRAALPRPIQISFLQGTWEIRARRGYNPLDQLGAWFFRHYLNLRFYRTLRSGVNVWTLPGVRAARTELGDLKSGSEIDFIALSFEGTLNVEFRPWPPFFDVAEATELNQAVPLDRLIRPVLRDGLPIQLLQVSARASAEVSQATHLEHLLTSFRHCLEKGIRIRTFMYGPLTDCFEWEKGLAPKRGLVEIEANSFRRLPKAIYGALKELLSAPRESSS